MTAFLKIKLLHGLLQLAIGSHHDSNINSDTWIVAPLSFNGFKARHPVCTPKGVNLRLNRWPKDHS